VHMHSASVDTCKSVNEYFEHQDEKGSRSEGELVKAPVGQMMGAAEDKLESVTPGPPPGAENGKNEDAMVEINDESEEAEPLVVAPSPNMPDPATVEEHRITHIPFRCWCKWCMMGRGLGE